MALSYRVTAIALLLVVLASHVSSVSLRFHDNSRDEEDLKVLKMNIADLKESAMLHKLSPEGEVAASRGRSAEGRMAQDEILKGDSQIDTQNKIRESTLEDNALAKAKAAESKENGEANQYRADADMAEEKKFDAYDSARREANDETQQASLKQSSEQKLLQDRQREQQEMRAVSQAQAAVERARDAVQQDKRMEAESDAQVKKAQAKLGSLGASIAREQGEVKNSEGGLMKENQHLTRDIDGIHNNEDIKQQAEADAENEARELSLGQQTEQEGLGKEQAPRQRLDHANKVEAEVDKDLKELGDKEGRVHAKVAAADARDHVAEDKLKMDNRHEADNKAKEARLEHEVQDDDQKQAQAQAMERKYKEMEESARQRAEDAAGKEKDARHTKQAEGDKARDLQREEATLSGDVKSSEDRMKMDQDEAKKDERAADEAEAEVQKAITKQQEESDKAKEDKKTFKEAAAKVQKDSDRLQKMTEYQAERKEDLALGKSSAKNGMFQNLRQAAMQKDSLERHKTEMEMARDRAAKENAEAQHEVEEVGEEVEDDKRKAKRLKDKAKEAKEERTESEQEWRQRKEKLAKEKNEERDAEDKEREAALKEQQEKRIADKATEEANHDTRKEMAEKQKEDHAADDKEQAKEKLQETKDDIKHLDRNIEQAQKEMGEAHEDVVRGEKVEADLQRQEARDQERKVGAEQERKVQGKLLEKAKMEVGKGQAEESAARKGLRFDKERENQADHKLAQFKQDMALVKGKKDDYATKADRAVQEEGQLQKESNQEKRVEDAAMKSEKQAQHQLFQDENQLSEYKLGLTKAEAERRGLENLIRQDESEVGRREQGVDKASRMQKEHMQQGKDAVQQEQDDRQKQQLASAAAKRSHEVAQEHWTKREEKKAEAKDIDNLTRKYLTQAHDDAGDAAAAWRDAERMGAAATTRVISEE